MTEYETGYADGYQDGTTGAPVPVRAYGGSADYRLGYSDGRERAELDLAAVSGS